MQQWPLHPHHTCLKISTLIENSRTYHLQSHFSHTMNALHTTKLASKSQHWPKIRKRITYNVISLTYNAYLIAKPIFIPCQAHHCSVASLYSIIQPCQAVTSSSLLLRNVLDHPFSYNAPGYGPVFLLVSVGLLTPSHLLKQMLPFPNRPSRWTEAYGRLTSNSVVTGN